MNWDGKQKRGDTHAIGKPRRGFEMWLEMKI